MTKDDQNTAFGIVALATIGLANAQNQPSTRPEFDVASVKQNQSDDPRSANFPLGPGNVYDANGGIFSAGNQTLITYIFFAYKIDGNQGQYLRQQLPDWVKTERFDIKARATGNPDKDQMRLMMRSLLADRFKLTLHSETREVPALALVLAKQGATGYQLQAHPRSSPCPATSKSYNDETVAGGFPLLCGGLLFQPPSLPGRTRRGARNVTLEFLADSLSAEASLGRPMLNRTGLSGTFDFTMEWAPDVMNTETPDPRFRDETTGPSFQQALRDQLGLKLNAVTAPMEVLVVDRIARPDEN